MLSFKCCWHRALPGHKDIKNIFQNIKKYIYSNCSEGAVVTIRQFLSLLSRSETCTLASSLEAVMGSDVCHALWLFLSPTNIYCSLVTYSLGPVCYVLWGTVGKGGWPRGLSRSKEADTERVIKWWRLLEEHRIGGPNQIWGWRKAPLERQCPILLTWGWAGVLAKQRKWCFVDRGRECAKVKRREKTWFVWQIQRSAI